jgi:hypothetical protein
MADIFCHPHPAAELAKSRNDRLWPSASFRCKQRLGRFRSEADIERQARSTGSVANDPKLTSGSSFNYLVGDGKHCRRHIDAVVPFAN